MSPNSYKKNYDGPYMVLSYFYNNVLNIYSNLENNTLVQSHNRYLEQQVNQHSLMVILLMLLQAFN